jgi:hypothetical protein
MLPKRLVGTIDKVTKNEDCTVLGAPVFTTNHGHNKQLLGQYVLTAHSEADSKTDFAILKEPIIRSPAFTTSTLAFWATYVGFRTIFLLPYYEVF